MTYLSTQTLGRKSGPESNPRETLTIRQERRDIWYELAQCRAQFPVDFLQLKESLPGTLRFFQCTGRMENCTYIISGKE